MRNQRLALVSMVIASVSVGARADVHRHARDVTPDPAPFFSNFSQALAFRGENDVLAFTGRAGFRRSENRGDQWRRAMKGFLDSRGVEPFGNGLCQAPSAPGTVYSAAGGGGIPGRPVFRTDDLGKSWRKTADVIDPALFPVDCAVDPSDPDSVYVLMADQVTSFNGSLFKSTDGGRTFAELPALSALQLEGAFMLRIPTARPQTLFIANETFDDNDGVWVSHDGGASFARLPASPFLPFQMAVHPTVPGLMFVTGLFDGLFRSSDDGATFTLVLPEHVIAVAFDPTDAAAVFAAAFGRGVFRSGDFGATFTRLPAPTAAQFGPDGVRSIGVSGTRPGRTHIYAGTDRGPYRSDDGGTTFVPLNDTYRGTAANDLAIDANGKLVVGAMHTVALWRAQVAGHPTSDSFDAFGAGLTTTQEDLQLEWDGVAVAASSVDANTTVVATVTNGVFSTADDGATWNKATFDPPESEPFFGTAVRLAFAPRSPSRVYLAPRGFGLFRSDDAGRSFVLAEDAEPRIGAIAVDPRDPDVVYLGTFNGGHGLFKSVDGGTTPVSLGVPGNFSTLAIDPRSPDTVYASNRAGGVLRTVDAGANWLPASTGLPPTNEVLAVAVDPGIANRVYAWVKAAGLFVSTDAGASWTAAETNEAARRSGAESGRASMVVDTVVPGRVYLGSSGVLQVDTLQPDQEGED